MSVRQSVPDPVEVSSRLWKGFHGKEGWDVGANCGQTVLEMAFEFLFVAAFEPSPDSFDAAQALIRQHRLHAMALNFALSDANGEIELAYPAREQRETGQLVTPGLSGMEWEPADWDAVEKVTVRCRTADSVAEQLGVPDFIKVDTEGHEARVLFGAGKIIEGGKTDFLVEFHSPDNHAACDEVLRRAGYATETVRHPHYEPQGHMWHQHGWIRALAPGRSRTIA